MTLDDYRQWVKDHILDEGAFVRAVFSGRQRGRSMPWRRVIVRPVLIKGGRHVQVSHFDETSDVTKNYSGPEVAKKVDELLALPFSDIHLQTASHDIHVQITKKGQVLIHRQEVPGGPRTPSLEHDRQKDLLLPVGQPDPFLQGMGIMTREGKVRARMRAKFRQINQFLKLVIETGVAELERSPADVGPTRDTGRPLRIVDCGCGNAYLTFAVYHYLNHVLHVPTQLTGVDVNGELIRRRAEQSQSLGWRDLTFQAIRITDYQPDSPPDVVLALHACDTATDEALAQAVKWRSTMIFAAPCCHHHLQQQLDRQSAPPPLGPVYGHGILKERLGDILTDTFRSLILRIVGYRTEVIEFVSAEHTDKNLMIRAVRSAGSGDPQALQEYLDLKRFFRVTPFLEQLLGQELAQSDKE